MTTLSPFFQIASRYGVPDPTTDTPQIVAARMAAKLTQLALLNESGYNPGPLAAPETGSSVPAPQSVGTVPPANYTARAKTAVGQKYSALVNELAQFRGLTKSGQRQFIVAHSGDSAIQNIDNDINNGYCQKRIHRTFAALGGEQYYPRADTAADEMRRLSTPPYNQYWQQMATNISIPAAASQYNGALVFWDESTGWGGGSGHVAIIYQDTDGRIYLLGNTDGNLATNVTSWTAARDNISAVFLPRSDGP